jgi:hypothetical protein
MLVDSNLGGYIPEFGTACDAVHFIASTPLFFILSVILLKVQFVSILVVREQVSSS